MALLDEIFEEGAVGGAATTTAGSIAGFRNFLGGKKKKPLRREFYGFRIIKEDQEENFDANDVISKLKNDSAQTKHQDTVAFGLEDENGNTVKVWVPKEQSDDFEEALRNELSPDDHDPEDKDMEVAEIIYKLRDRFTIVDVKWDEIEEDQEESIGQTGAPEAGTEGGEAPPPQNGEVPTGGEEGTGSPQLPDMEPGVEEPGVGDEAAAQSALQQVINMMKADAEAKKAQAEAEAAKAQAEQVKHTVDLANVKMKGEEETLDMEDYYNKQREEKAESDKLAKLARYRHDLAKDDGSTLETSAFESVERERILKNLLAGKRTKRGKNGK